MIIRVFLAVLFAVQFYCDPAVALQGRFSFGGEVVAGTTSYDMPYDIPNPPIYHQETMGGLFVAGELKLSENTHIGLNIDVSWIDNETSDASVLVTPQFTLAIGTEMGRTSETLSANIGLRVGVGPSYCILPASEKDAIETLGGELDSNVGLGFSVDLLLILHVTESMSTLLTVGYQGNWNTLEFSLGKESFEVDQAVHTVHFRIGLLFGE